MSSKLSHLIALTALIPFSMTGLLLGINQGSAVANSFDSCVRDLVQTGVNSNEAGTGCSRALIPNELSSCVVNIKNNTSITGEDALKACYQVRRPVDMGDCVVDIQKIATKGQDNPPQLALDTCQKSLLPLRHSECVIGLSNAIPNVSPAQNMTTCLAAQDFPPDLFPH